MDLQTDKTFVYINTRDEMSRIDLRQIVYFKADRNYTEAFFRNGTSLLLGVNIQTIEKILDMPDLKGRIPVFARIGRSYIVATRYIQHINLLNLTLTLSDVMLPTVYHLNVPKEALKKLKEFYTQKVCQKH